MMKTRRCRADGGVRLTVRWPACAGLSRFRCGERVRAVARLLPPEVIAIPVSGAAQDYLLDQGITSTASCVERIERIGRLASRTSPLGRWRAVAGSIRCRIERCAARGEHSPACVAGRDARIAGAIAPQQEDAVMLAAMVTGDRTFLTHSLRVGFERTGSFHMLVVSGFHLAIVAGFIFWIAKTAAVAACAGHADHDRGVFRICALYGVRDAGAALALDGDAVSAGPAGLSRTQRNEHDRLCVLVPAGREPAQLV